MARNKQVQVGTNGDDTMLKTMTVNLLLVGWIGSVPVVYTGEPQATQVIGPCSIGNGKGVIDGRLELPSQTHQLKLEETNEIPLLLHGYKVHSANATWRYYNADGGLLSPDDSTDLAVMYHTDGSAYVVIVPEKPGKIQLAIGACFEDGFLANAWGDAEVVFPDRKPKSVYVVSPQSSDERPFGTIYLGLSERPRTMRIYPKALYKSSFHLVPIPATQVSFDVITAAENGPPIAIDKSTGVITALRIGHALIKTTFEGSSVLTCVDVMNDAKDGSDRTVCQELVPEGMAAPLTGFENDNARPQVKPYTRPKQ